MLSLRIVRRFGSAKYVAQFSAASFSSSNPNFQSTDNRGRPLDLEDPALVKLKAERNPEKLYQLFKANAHNKLVIENRFAFEDTVSRLAGAGRFDYIEELLEHQKTLKQGQREGFIVRIIMLYGKAGMTKHAVDTFNDMHLYGCSRTVKSFNATLRVLTQSSKFDELESFFVEAPRKFGIELDVFSLNIIVKALCDMGISDKAYLVLLEMEKSGIQPDVVTYTTLMTASYKINQVEIGNGIWNLMVRKGISPNLTTFNIRIQYLVNRSRAWQANRLLKIMRHLKISPDDVTYNLILTGFCRSQNLDMAKRIYAALLREGHKPNVKIYQTMIHYLCKEGDFEMAYTLSTESMVKNWFPNVDTVYKLLEGLKKTGKVDKGWYILSLARKRKPPFPSVNLDLMESILSTS